MTPLPLAVVVHDKGEPIEDVFAAARDVLAHRPDLRLAGVVPRFGPPHANGRRSMWLDDLRRGDSIPISQDLGVGSTACCLDPNGIATLSVRLAEAIDDRPDVLFCGRFAKEELAGRGIRAEVALAVEAGIATLVAVDRTMLDGWIAFAGDDWTALPPEASAIVDWIAALHPLARTA